MTVPMRKRTWSILLFLLLLIFPGNFFHLLDAQEVQVQTGLPIDLTKLRWIATQGFSPASQAHCQLGAKSRYIESFPIILNKVFDIPTGHSILHYTLCVRVNISENDLQAPLAIHLPWVGEAWELFLNGQLIRHELPLDSKGDLAARRIFRHLTIPLERNQLRTGENHIVLHLAGYQAPTILENNTNLGFLFKNGYELDRLDRLQRKHADYFRVITITIFTFFGLYHLLFFTYRMRDRYNLFFGLFLLAMAGNSLMGNIFTNELYRDLGTINRLKYMFQSFSVPMILLFVTEYFLGKDSPSSIKLAIDWIGRTVLFYFSGLGLSFLLIPFEYTEAGLLIFQFSLMPVLIFAIYLIGYIIFKRKEDSFFMGLGLFVLIGTAAWDIFGVASDFLLAPYGTLACIFALVFMLARRFLRINMETDRLNQELFKQKNSFQRFVPIQFLDLLKKEDITQINLGDSSLRRMSVLFADIRSFTQITEHMPADDNFKFLNSFLKRMEPNIQRNGGFVDKYIGDAILALFPERKQDAPSARGAVQTAIDLQSEIGVFNEQRTRDGLAAIELGVAVNSGEVMLGTVGSDKRLDTTVIGNVVNLSSRLESLNKFYHSRILITGYTREALPDAEKYLMREIDSVRVVGKTTPVIIHEVYQADPPEICKKKESTRQDLFNAIVLYKLRKFKDALEILDHIASIFPEDRVAQIYRDRCREYQEIPPDDNWQGVVVLTHK